MPARPALAAATALLAAFALGAGGAVLLAGEQRPDPVATGSPSPAASRSPSPAGSPTPPPVPPVTAEALGDAAVPSLCDHPAGRLVDGHLPGTPPGEQGVQLQEAAVGDLDGDGVAEGVALVSCSDGGNTLSTSVHVYRSGPAHVTEVDVAQGLDRGLPVTGVAVADGRLVVSGRYYGPDDAQCCPTGRVARAFRLDGDVAVLVPSGLSPQAPVTGSGWGSARVGATYDELARATGLPVLLSTLEDDVAAELASCAYVTLAGQDRVAGLGGDGRLRALVFAAPGVLSRSGVGVGSSEDEVLAAYGARARRVPNEYGSVDDVVVPAGDGLVVRFELGEDRRVERMHAGEQAWAVLAEGCA